MPPHLVFVSMPLAQMALLSAFLSHFLSLSFQVGWRKRPTIDLIHHVARVFPAPSPGQPSLVPHFVLLGEGPSLPMAPLSPCGPVSFPTPRLPPTFPHFSLWLASLPLQPLPLFSIPFLCLSPSLPCSPAPHFLHGLFFTPLGPVSWLMPSPVLILNNYQIYQWGEKRCVCVVLASQSCGQMGCPLPAPTAG